MKVRRLFIAFLFVICIFFTSNKTVNAVRYDCSTKAISELKSLAYNIFFTYDLYNTYNEQGIYYFYINLDNFSNKFYILSNNSYEIYSDKKTIEKQGEFLAGNTYTFDVISSFSSSCPGKVLYTKRIKFPYYNDFSIRKECIGIEGLDVCDKWIEKPDISEEEFVEIINNYHKGSNSDDDTVKELNFLEKFIKLYVDNLVISISITIFVLIIVAIIIIKIVSNNKKKIKIKI